MKTHELKIWPEYFKAKLQGLKPWERRIDDRNYDVGDTVYFKEWKDGVYTGRTYGPVVISYLIDVGETVIFTHTTKESNIASVITDVVDRVSRAPFEDEAIIDWAYCEEEVFKVLNLVARLVEERDDHV